MSGFCPQGHQWVVVPGGRRCAGGAHFLADNGADLDEMGDAQNRVSVVGPGSETDAPPSIQLQPSASRADGNDGPFNIPRSALTLDKKSFAKGSFSRAYKGTYHDTPIVAKVFKTDYIPVDALKRNVAKEAALMAKCSHPCVVRSHGVCADFNEDLEEPFVALVMDPYPEGTARDLVEKTGGPLPGTDAARILESVAWGLDHLHGLGIVHKDLRVESILIDKDEDGRALGVVSDFGLSVDLTSETDRYDNYGGTVFYQAPEQLKPFAPDGELFAITPKADMYAFGVVAWVLATSKEPWEGENQLVITQLVTEQHKRLIFPAPADEKWAAIQELAKECFSADPNMRPTAQQAAERLRTL